jgi:hypothetical protein
MSTATEPKGGPQSSNGTRAPPADAAGDAVAATGVQAGVPTVAPAATPSALPAYMLDETGLAFDLQPGDTTAPVIRLLQTKKPRRGDFGAVPAGHFVNTNTGEDLGAVLHVAVLGVLRSRAAAARRDPGGHDNRRPTRVGLDAPGRVRGHSRQAPGSRGRRPGRAVGPAGR